MSIKLPKTRFASALSWLFIVLMLAVIILWILSFWLHISARYVLPWQRTSADGRYVLVEAAAGRVTLKYVVYFDVPKTSTFDYAARYLDYAERTFVLASFRALYGNPPNDAFPAVYWYHHRHRAGTVKVDTWGLMLAPWVCVLAFLTAVVPHLVLALQSRRRWRPHLCPACGYDLRGSLHSEACPECGERIAWSKRRAVSVARTQPAKGNSPPA